MEQNKEAQRSEWRERQQRSRQKRAAKGEEDEIRELASELKRAIRESPDRTVPRWFFAEYGITATMEAMKFLKIAPVSDVSVAPSAAHTETLGWWIDKSSAEILARISETNPASVDSLFKNRKPTLEPQEVSDGPV
jgi:hypothetical protein